MSVRKFTVEGDPLDVIALAEKNGWKITHPRWWQKRTLVNVWVLRLLWLSIYLNAFVAILRFVRYVGG